MRRSRTQFAHLNYPKLDYCPPPPPPQLAGLLTNSGTTGVGVLNKFKTLPTITRERRVFLFAGGAGSL